MTLAWAQSIIARYLRQQEPRVIISLDVYAQGKDNMAVKVRMG